MKLEHDRACYSDANEEPFVQEFFRDFKGGHFVDIGANNGWKGSNTFRLITKGWSGLYAEADPKTYRSLLETCSHYPGQTSAWNYAIWDKAHSQQLIPFYSHNVEDSGLSSVAREFPTPVQSTCFMVECVTIDEFLRRHWFGDVYIDFLAIDTEGCDFESLRDYSFSWKPRLIMAEISPLGAKKDYEALLTPLGYRFCFHNESNVAFALLK